MLLTSQITNFVQGSNEWFEIRKSRFTSSEVHELMCAKMWDNGALKYIYRKVGEDISGVPIRNEIETAATAHGNIYEREGIRKYGRAKGLEYVITQKLILDLTNKCSSTPDFLEIISETKDSEGNPGYNVRTGEVKCPLTYDAFIGLSLCNTPEDLKRKEDKYYWQVLDQMLVCGALYGVFVLYHPDFGEAGIREIQFRKLAKNDKGINYIKDDMDALNERKMQAVITFNEVKAKLLKI